MKFSRAASGQNPQSEGIITYSSKPVAIAINAGIEFWPTKWLAARGGIYYAFGKREVTIDSTFSNTPVPITRLPQVDTPFLLVGGSNSLAYDGAVGLGFGFVFGKLRFDATICQLIGIHDNLSTFGFLSLSFYYGR